MRKANTANYKAIFDLEMKLLEQSFNELLAMTDEGIISAADLNKNVKAVNWLSRTFTSNIEQYMLDYEESLAVESTVASKL